MSHYVAMRVPASENLRLTFFGTEIKARRRPQTPHVVKGLTATRGRLQYPALAISHRHAHRPMKQALQTVGVGTWI